MKTVSISREEEGYWFAHEAFGNPARQGAEPGLRGLPPGPGTGHQGSNPEEARDGGAAFMEPGAAILLCSWDLSRSV